jgi:PAS domain S-box-containing protein
MDLLQRIVATDLMPDGYCFFWRPEVLWRHVASDALIALACFAIPAALFALLGGRREIPFPWRMGMVAAFSLAGGLTHLVSIWSVWQPDPELEGLVKAGTALLAVATMATLLQILPKARARRSPRELEALNQRLRHEIVRHEATAAELRQAKDALESRVSERTRELERANAALRASEARVRAQLDELETLYHTAPIGLALLDPELRFVRVNEALAEINGPSVAEHLGRLAWEVVPDLRAAAEPRLRRVLATGEPVRDLVVQGETPRAPGVTRDWVEQFYPLKDETGRVVAIGIICREVTEWRRAEAARRESEARFRQLIEAAPDAVLIHRDFAITFANPGAAKLFGLAEPGQLLGRTITDFFAEEDLPAIRARTRQALAEGRALPPHRRRLRRADGGWVPVESTGVAIEDGGAPAILTLHRDVSEQHRAEERQRLLLAELDHRVKNSLALVQAIANQTGRRAATLEGFLAAFRGRLAALAATHGLLVRGGWRGAELARLARVLLAPHPAVAEGRLVLQLPEVILPPALTQDLALVLHELATNAVKHGALSRPAGRVALAGRVEGAELVLVWHESGGPAVVAPAGRGFGMTLLTQAVAHQHQGRVDLAWRAEGLVGTVRLPLALTAAPPAAAA